MTIDELIEALQRMPLKHRPIYLEPPVRDALTASTRIRLDSISIVTDEGPFAIVRREKN